MMRMIMGKEDGNDDENDDGRVPSSIGQQNAVSRERHVEA
jgi:hypothetical protein